MNGCKQRREWNVEEEVMRVIGVLVCGGCGRDWDWDWMGMIVG